MLMVVRHADAGDKRRWDGPDVSRPLSPTWPKGSTWLLQRNGQRQVRARYLPPLVLDRNTLPPMGVARKGR